MKTFKLFLSISLFVFFISCSEDDGSNTLASVSSDQLEGTWKLTEITQDGNTSTTVEGITISIDFSSYGKDIDAQIVLTRNPNNFISSGSYTAVTTYTVLGQSTTEEIPVPIDSSISNGSWSVDNGVLSVTQNNETQTSDILEFSNSKMVLETEILQDISSQGFDSTAETTVRMTLERQ